LPLAGHGFVAVSQSAYGAATPTDSADDYAATLFTIRQLLAKIQTVTLVKVIACTNSAGISPVGTVDVQPLVNQLSGNSTATAYAPLYKLPYFRLQGGASAVILDPVPGDIGMAGFCSRDISAVKKTKAQANPGSLRKYDFADGLYFGGMLNGTPTQYLAFAAGGITIMTPNAVTITATGGITLNGMAIDSSANVTGPGTLLFAGNVSGGGKSLDAHVHSGVQSGGSDTGPPV
jgi:phage baseplate assembly protein gpV